ncbi:MAG TPA: SRPBCC family protein [Marmoricola sp.]|nr:SRPBCC family protein [Marmoricola sp.]
MLTAPSVFVAAPRPQVYAYLADPRNRPEWQASLARVELLDEGPPRVGMRWRDHLRGGAAFGLRITEMVPDERWAEVGTTGPFTADITMLFEDAVRDGIAGTRVRLVVRVRGRGAARPLGRLGTGALSLAVRMDLPRLARVVESR